jgi:3-phenylpropionate/trans-cinnamate dioxygenase ferredoxin reductase subunit
MSDPIIIIGASHAGAGAASALRQMGYAGAITLIGEEDVAPYHRPPLSKAYLSGEMDRAALLLRPAESYAAHDIDLRLGTRVGAIHLDDKTVQLGGGERLSWSQLILATGARVRSLPIPGADREGVFYLRDSRHVEAIRGRIEAGGRAVIIGGGYIGLETAASLTKLGMEVTLLEAQERILQRVTSPVMSDFYRQVHGQAGVTILEGCLASEIAHSGDTPLLVKTSCGQSHAADLVIIGIGVIPNTELAEFAGLTISNGIQVNEFCQTSHPDVFAIGDVAAQYSPLYDRQVRIESVPDATEQAKTVARFITGDPKPHDTLPWFWSDQFDLKLQIAGLSQGYDDLVLRGNQAEHSFAAYYFEGERLLAVDAVNAPRDFMMAKMALSKGKTLDKTILADPEAPLKTALK